MSDSRSIPTDIDELTSLVKELREQITHQSFFIDQLLEQIKLAKHQRFGVCSEHISPDQLRLLLEEKDADVVPVDDDADELDKTQPNEPSAKPKKRGRRKLPDHLPRVEIKHTLDEEACQCEHCQAMMEPLSQKITDQFDIIPAQVRVIRHLRQTYRCPQCEDAFVTAAMPPQPIPKSNATASTLVYLIIAKIFRRRPSVPRRKATQTSELRYFQSHIGELDDSPRSASATVDQSNVRTAD